MGGGLVFGLISARVWEFLFLLSFFLFFWPCASWDAEVGSGHSKKLYYLDVTYLNINKAFPYKKKDLLQTLNRTLTW
jgi:hypothetical protein